MRIVLDTNVLISTLLGGILHVIIDRWKEGEFNIVVSESVVREYIDVINRPKFRFSKREIVVITDYILKNVEIVTPSETIDLITSDPGDNKFLECAKEGRVDFIVSGDKHLLELRSYQNIPIISGRDFIEHLETQR